MVASFTILMQKLSLVVKKKISEIRIVIIEFGHLKTYHREQHLN